MHPHRRSSSRTPSSGGSHGSGMLPSTHTVRGTEGSIRRQQQQTPSPLFSPHLQVLTFPQPSLPQHPQMMEAAMQQHNQPQMWYTPESTPHYRVYPQAHHIPLPYVANSQYPPVLSAYLEHAHYPMVEWDIRYDPQHYASLNQRRTRSGGVHQGGHWMNAPAANPSIRSITIRIPYIDAYTSPVVICRNEYREVDVGDVLVAVYERLVKAAEDMLYPARSSYSSGLFSPSPPGGMRRTSQHRGQHPVTDEQIRIQIRALLRGRTLWAGLSPSRHERDVWILKVM